MNTEASLPLQFYLVGGAVRDRLMGITAKDRDWVVTGATPDIMLQLGYQAVGKDFPVFLHPVTHEEYALARTERKVARGYHGFETCSDATVTLKDDLQRRDLTINALAEDQNGQVIDYYGGLNDLKHRILRHVSPAFAEDPVRILRVARFMARYRGQGFQIAPETLDLMRELVTTGEVDSLVAERVWQELVKALQEPQPEAFFQTLEACYALAVLFPELAALTTTQRQTALEALQRAVQLSIKPEIRWAALVQCLSVNAIEALSGRYRSPNSFRELALLAAQFTPQLHSHLSQTPEQQLALLEQTDAFRKPDRLKDLLKVAHASDLSLVINQTWPSAAHILKQLDLCQQIDIQNILQQGFKGEAIKQEIRRQRLALLAAGNYH
ncbi:CCA tRNA nucleotidyltransferase [Thiolinea disciformis]|uniref:CCA tRNA nucleotidyltransferase n=1 Tax=Thiolinea disciformis TaxID=125614 RepID=UPI00035D1967|nr:CCA tRNA nucleotidyltransferase [Thiolinea disciformis]